MELPPGMAFFGDLNMPLDRTFRIQQDVGDSERRLIKHTTEYDGPSPAAYLTCGVSAMQGRRPTMEDAHLLSKQVGPNMYLFAVFDGHGGDLASKYAEGHFADTLCNDSSFALFRKSDDPNDASHALFSTCMLVDAEMRRELPQAECMGSTAVVLLVTANWLICANVGDSRCIVEKAGEVIAMSTDHKPGLQGEYDRITKAGGFVFLGRVNGSLAVARALGDFSFKVNTDIAAELQAVTAAPEISVHRRSAADNFVVLACDGIWDVVDNEECRALVENGLKAWGNSVGQICEDVIQTCYDKGSRDNMSIAIIKF